MAQQPKPTDGAVIVQVQPADTVQHQLGDVIIGSIGLTGALVLAAALSGGLLAGLWIVWRKSRRTYETDAPPSLGSVALGSRSEINTKAEPELDQRPNR